jgi:FAD synthetase
MKKILVTGTFDILHPGHLSLFKQAKKLGDFLIVVVARDSTVIKIKGAAPQHNQHARIRAIKKLKVADRIMLGRRVDKLKIIDQLKPDIVGLGYDQHAFTKNLRHELKKRGLAPHIVRLKPYRPHRYKSSLLRPA